MFYPHTTLTLTLTPSHPYSSGKKASCLLRILWMGVRFNRQGAKKAAVYRQYSYAALLVQLCCTFGARMLYSSGTTRTVGIPMLDCWYSYAGLLVPVCYTFLVPFFHDVYSRRIDEQTCWRIDKEICFSWKSLFARLKPTRPIYLSTRLHVNSSTIEYSEKQVFCC